MKAVAEKLLSYYGKMESRYGGYWKADIHAAATWLALLNSVEEPSDAAIAGLLAKLNAATAHRGTAWEEMSLNIRAWVKSMQQKRALASVGTGFLFPTRAGEIALDACLRVLRLKWPRAAFQACNALQAPCGYEALSIGRATALFV